MSQKGIEFEPLFTGISGEIENVLRVLGQKPTEQSVNLRQLSGDKGASHDLGRQIYNALMERDVLLPCKIKGRPRTRLNEPDSRVYLTGNERTRIEQEIVLPLIIEEQMTYQEIVDRTDLSLGQVNYALLRLRESELIPRRRRHRPPEVITAFDNQVEARLEKDLTDRQIAAALDPMYSDHKITPQDVCNARHRLKRQHGKMGTLNPLDFG